MRNLKKVLSLALALVMLLGMMVVGAGAAADFKDADKIENTEAVDVVSGIEVLKGDEKGNFNPEGTLTRAEAAVVIAKLDLGEAFGNLATTNASTFTDVPDGYWAKPFIDYCFARGLIAGVGNQKYNPNGKVSGVEFALMVSRVLGYEDKAEGINGGNDWAVKAAALARKAGLTKDVTLTYPTAISRDEMAQVSFNALKADMVYYPNGTIDITVSGTPVTIGGSPAEPKNTETNTLGDGNKNLQLAEEKFPQLKVRLDADDFGRPSTVWTYNRKDICSEVVPGYVEYSKKVTYSAIKSALNAGSAKVVVVEDGKPEAAVSKAATDEFGGNGVLTQAWYTKDEDGNNIVKITLIHTYVARVSSVNKAKETVSLNKLSTRSGASVNSTYATTSFAVNDLVTYQIAWNGKSYDVVDVKPLTNPATGSLTEWNGLDIADGGKGNDKVNFTVGGEKYTYSAHNVVIDASGGTTGGIWSYPLKSSTLNVYTDEYGYALYVDAVEAELNYAIVIGVGNNNPYGSSSKGCTLMFADGTTKEVQYVMTSATPELTGGNEVKEGKGDIVTYTVDDDNVYHLTLLGDGAAQGKYSTTNVASSNIAFTNGKSELKLGNQTYYATAETIFVVATSDKDSATTGETVTYANYKGYANMPSFADSKAIFGYTLRTNGTYTQQADVVYIHAKSDSIAGITGVNTYFVKAENSVIVTNNMGSYYVLPAIVDGEETKVMVKTDAWSGHTAAQFKDATGLFTATSVVKDKNDIITNFTDATNNTTFAASTIANRVSSTKGTVRDPSGRAVLGIGNNGNKDTAKYWAYTSKTSVLLVDDKYTSITLGSTSTVENDPNDLVYAANDDNTKVLTTLIIVKQDDPKTVTLSWTVPTGVTGFKVEVNNVTKSSGVELNGGETIKVSANVPAGKRLEFTVGDNSYNIAGNSNTTFTMPSEGVTLAFTLTDGTQIPQSELSYFLKADPDKTGDANSEHVINVFYTAGNEPSKSQMINDIATRLGITSASDISDNGTKAVFTVKVGVASVKYELTWASGVIEAKKGTINGNTVFAKENTALNALTTFSTGVRNSDLPAALTGGAYVRDNTSAGTAVDTGTPVTQTENGATVKYWPVAGTQINTDGFDLTTGYAVVTGAGLSGDKAVSTGAAFTVAAKDDIAGAKGTGVAYTATGLSKPGYAVYGTGTISAANLAAATGKITLTADFVEVTIKLNGDAPTEAYSIAAKTTFTTPVTQATIAAATDKTVVTYAKVETDGIVITPGSAGSDLFIKTTGCQTDNNGAADVASTANLEPKGDADVTITIQKTAHSS